MEFRNIAIRYESKKLKDGWMEAEEIKNKTPQQLTVPEKLELIKQLCPELNRKAADWMYIEFHSALARELPELFTDYLAKQMVMEVRNGHCITR